MAASNSGKKAGVRQLDSNVDAAASVEQPAPVSRLRQYRGEEPGAEMAIASAVEALETPDTIPVEERWRSIKNALAQELGGSQAFAAAAAFASPAAAEETIVGTGIGLRVENNAVIPEVVVKVYVTRKVYGGPVSSYASVPRKYDGMDVAVEEVGTVIPYGVPCGSSTGHFDVTAGTIGCLVAARMPGSTEEGLFILSNNHVLANCNLGTVGDQVFQPGKQDGGIRRPANQAFAVLDRFVRLEAGSVNRVDAALALTNFDQVNVNHPNFTISTVPVKATLGMSVKKHGRTTGFTMGQVTDVFADVQINYRPGLVVTFQDQIGIVGTGGSFSKPGDSGSTIVTLGTNQPVGLLFGGKQDNSVTYANWIEDVQTALGGFRFINAVE